MQDKHIIIGIAGPSCSGKSVLARRLIEHLDAKSPVVLSLDSYYHDLSHLAPHDREKHNFDVPEALDSELLRNHLHEMTQGHLIEIPAYDFVTHTRLEESIPVKPGDLIIIEGLFVLYWKKIRSLLDLGVFVMVDDQLGLARRLERDMRERGRTRESVLGQYATTVRPMNEQYILPTRDFADKVVNGENPVDQSAKAIAAYLSELSQRNPEPDRSRAEAQRRRV
jgi:uridine kinase